MVDMVQDEPARISFDATMSLALFTAAQAREIDSIAITQFGYSGLALMKRAGHGAFEFIQQQLPTDGKIVVLCGPGNNGGDGYVVAKLFHRYGADVRVIQSSPPTTDSAKQVCEEYVSSGGRFAEEHESTILTADLIVDGLLGAGINRSPHEKIARLLHFAAKAPCPVVALDLPSGLDGDTGFAFAPTLSAKYTVTFIVAKSGLYTGDGPSVCGEVIVDHLDLNPDILAGISPAAHRLSSPKISARPVNSHKGLFGSVLIAGGDSGMSGAVLLAGKAALRTGAGLVTVASKKEHCALLTLAQPELMTIDSDIVENLNRVTPNASVVGPGTRANKWGLDMFSRFADSANFRVVDAGGLRLLAESADHRANQVLTPHPGEAAALLNISTKDVQQNRIATAKRIVERYGGTCVLKGSGTIVTNGLETMICQAGNPGMASAGMGDVLSGIIGALLAAGMSCFDAACTGVWLHGTAGDKAEVEKGEHAMIASDVIDALPGVIQQVTQDR